jgi:hypothetical protein
VNVIIITVASLFVLGLAVLLLRSARRDDSMYKLEVHLHFNRWSFPPRVDLIDHNDPVRWIRVPELSESLVSPKLIAASSQSVRNLPA